MQARRDARQMRTMRNQRSLKRAWAIALLVVVFANGALSAESKAQSADVGNSILDERCEYPSVFGNMLVPHEKRLGELRITLSPPDYQSAASLQRHLAFSSIWAQLLSAELRTQTGGQCSAVIGPDLFPDLRIYLTRNRSGRDKGADLSMCVYALQEALVKSRFDRQSITMAASAEARRKLQRISNPAGAGAIINANNILDIALAYIYESHTVMHALVSLGPEVYEALDVNDFVGWVQAQRSAVRLGLSPLAMCAPDTEQRSSQVRAATGRLPYSGIIPPAPLTLSVNADTPDMMRLLRHAVIVGNGPAIANSRFSTPATDKYCNQTRAFTIGRDSGSDVAIPVHIRCLRAVVHNNDGWTVFFCDPVDCTESAAEEAMAAIASDNDVLDHAKDDEKKHPRGPYLIKVEYRRK